MLPKPVFTILVVDDEPPIHDLLTRVARQQFAEAQFVNTRSAQETFTYLGEQSAKWPQLVLLDINLHQSVDGIDLLPQLHQRLGGQVPIVMFTTDTDPTLMEQAHERGAVAFTQKPDDLQGWREYVASLRATWYQSKQL